MDRLGKDLGVRQAAETRNCAFSQPAPARLPLPEGREDAGMQPSILQGAEHQRLDCPPKLIFPHPASRVDCRTCHAGAQRGGVDRAGPCAGRQDRHLDLQAGETYIIHDVDPDTPAVVSFAKNTNAFTVKRGGLRGLTVFTFQPGRGTIQDSGVADRAPSNQEIAEQLGSAQSLANESTSLSMTDSRRPETLTTRR